MAGYRCVNYFELCRLCTSSSANDKKINIFSEEGTKLELSKKIQECLPVSLNEKDKLPKSICSTCLEYVEFITDYRKTTSNAQDMLKSCLNTSKLRNGGQVYIKDETNTPKKFLKTINQNKMQNKQIQIITTSPQQNHPQTPQKVIKKITTASTPGSDFLSSIIQAVGIHNTEEVQQPIQTMPQYTFTLDGQTLKGPVQYKLENTNPSKTITVESPQQQSLNQMDEFIKMKPVQQKTMSTPSCPKNKKPKINLIVTTPTKQSTTLHTPQPKAFGAASTLNTPNKSGIQIQDIKIIPSSNMVTTPTQTPTKQFVVPIVLKNDGTTTTDTSQLISQALVGANNNCMTSAGPIHYVQMKIQPNADGQPGFHLAPASIPPTASISLSPQQLQSLSFSSPQTPTHQTHLQALLPPPQQQSQGNQTEIKTSDLMDEMDHDDNDNSWLHIEDNNDYQNEQKPEPTENPVVITVSQDHQSSATQNTITITGTPKSLRTLQQPAKTSPSTTNTIITSHNQSMDTSPNKSQLSQQEQSELATMQLHQLSSHSIKNTTSGSPSKSQEINLTICDVCKKSFKKKEHLMQHLKSHVGLRPFKCKDSACNKSFSRKEHLLRHMCTHTGKKMFSCDLCHKLFSRKDNLNKHRRIHPEANGNGTVYTCPTCSKQYVSKSLLNKCKESHEPDSTNRTGKTKSIVKFKATKKVKCKEEKPDEPNHITISQNILHTEVQTNQPQPLQQQQQPQAQQPQQQHQQQQQQQIVTFLQPDQSKQVLFTIPSNFVLTGFSTPQQLNN